MSTEFQTADKDFFKHSFHKSDFSFSSPKQNLNTTLPKVPFLQSRRVDTMRNRIELFAQMKQNIEIVSMINKSYSKQFVQQMKTQQRVEVQKLLLQISRLHDLLQDQERIHRHTIQRLKQQSEQIALLRISNLKQSQFSQLQTLELQLKKTRETLQIKQQLFEELQKSTSRTIENLTNQNQSLKADLKSFIQKKNIQLYQLKNQFNKQSQQSSRKREQQMQQIKQFADKQLKKVLKRLQQKENQIQHLAKQKQKASNQIINNQQLFQKQKQELSNKIQRIIQHQRQRQDQIKQNFRMFYQSESYQTQQDLNLQKQLFQRQIEQLMKVIRIKDVQIQRNLVFRQTQKTGYNIQIQNYQKENQYLRNLIYDLKKQHIQDIQTLKVKMGLLHKSDLESLVNLYESKIQNLSKDLQFAQNQSQKLMAQSKKQRQVFYQMKKKYDYTISFLNQQILQQKSGTSSMERDMKDKLENQKSMMMITSRNFIKENQLKNNNIRFYEQQLRKLRQLLQIQAQQVEQSQKNVQQKIKLAQDQLSRLSNKIIQVKSEAEQNEKRLKAIIEQKDQQIKKLNQLLINSKVTKNQDFSFRQQIKRLDEQMAKKQDQLRFLRNRCQQLQSQIRLVKSQNERLHMQAQINSEDAKRQYKVISDKNLTDMRAFYQRRLQELEHDKKQLNRVISSQSQQITELIKRYKQLQQGMKVLLKQVKKRGDLETRIIELGMDNNLVKNMAEIFHK